MGVVIELLLEQVVMAISVNHLFSTSTCSELCKFKQKKIVLTLGQHFRIIDDKVEIIRCIKITKHHKENELSLSDAMMQSEAPITHASKYLTGSNRNDRTLRIDFGRIQFKCSICYLNLNSRISLNVHAVQLWHERVCGTITSDL